MPISKERLNEMKKQSQKQIDFSDIPPMTDAQLAAMRPMRETHPEWIIPADRTIVSVPIDNELLKQFNATGISLESFISKSIRSVVDSLAS